MQPDFIHKHCLQDATVNSNETFCRGKHFNVIAVETTVPDETGDFTGYNNHWRGFVQPEESSRSLVD